MNSESVIISKAQNLKISFHETKLRLNRQSRKEDKKLKTKLIFR